MQAVFFKIKRISFFPACAVRIIFSKAAKLQSCLFRMNSDSRHDVEGGHVPN